MSTNRKHILPTLLDPPTKYASFQDPKYTWGTNESQNH